MIGKILKIILSIQIALYALAMFLIFALSGLDGLVGLVPIVICVLLAPISGILTIIYGVLVYTKREVSDKTVWILFAAMVALGILYVPIVNIVL
jgi:hypothetical protein